MFDANVTAMGEALADIADSKSSMGGSPDGLGAYAQPLVPSAQAPMPPNLPVSPGAMYPLQRPAHVQQMVLPGGGGGMGPHRQVGFEIEQWEPKDASEDNTVKSAGITALIVATSVGIGIAAGGPWGAGSGLMLSSAMFNGYRAQKWWGQTDPQKKSEAVVSAVFALAGLGFGAYAAYKAYEANEANEAKKGRSSFA